MTRGVKKEVDNFIWQLMGKWFPYRHKKEAPADQMIQVQVRPIQLWEIVFPREGKDVVLTTCLGKEKADGSYEGYGKGKSTQHKKHDKFVWALRKAIGANKIGKWEGGQMMPIDRGSVETIGIGLKDDYENEDGFEQL